MIAWIFLLLNLGFAIAIFFLVIAFVTGAPYVPTKNDVAASMMRLAKIKRGDTVVDLGSGDGKLLLLAAQNGAGKAIGYEINPYLVLLSRLRVLLSPFGYTIKTYFHNFWTADISDADVVFVYLLPWRMEQLARKLRRELKPSALVVSNSFIFPNWKILREDRKNHVYVFRT
jgi:ribosomal protein L11 methylase PrmA